MQKVQGQLIGKSAIYRKYKTCKRVIDRLLYDLDMQYEISTELFTIYMTMQKF